MRRLGTILTREIPWGRLAGIAVVTAFLFVLLYNQAVGYLALLIFVIGGLLVAQGDTRRPFWNALAYGCLSILFVSGLLLLYLLGEQGQLVIGPQVSGMILFLCISILPQVMVGALIGVSFRRIRSAGERLGERAKERQPRGKPQAPREDTPRAQARQEQREK